MVAKAENSFVNIVPILKIGLSDLTFRLFFELSFWPSNLTFIRALVSACQRSEVTKNLV